MSIDLINQVLVLGLKWMLLSLVVITLVRRSRNSSAQVLQGVLASALLALFVTPLLSVFGPSWRVPILPDYFAAWLVWPVTQGEAFNEFGRWAVGIFCVWVLVCGFLFVRWVLDLMTAYGLARASRPVDKGDAWQSLQRMCHHVGLRRSVDLRESEDVQTPMTLGALVPVILLPAAHGDWTSAQLERFLMHEVAHIQRHDWLQKMVGQILVACLWFLPSAWWLQKKALWYAELACDDKVIEMDHRRDEYAQDLLTVGEGLGPSLRGGLALIDGSVHFHRIEAMLDSSRVRFVHRPKYWLYVLSLLLVAALLANVKLGIEPPIFAHIKPTIIIAQMPAPEQQPNAICDPKDCVINSPIKRPEIPESIPVLKTTIPHSIDAHAIKPELTATLIDQSLRPQLHVARAMPLVRTTSITPEYPAKALNNNVEGWVEVQFDVFSDGKTGNIRIIASSTKNIFDEAVIAAVQQFVYQPQPAAEGPVVHDVTEVFKFRIIEDAKSQRNRH